MQKLAISKSRPFETRIDECAMSIVCTSDRFVVQTSVGESAVFRLVWLFELRRWAVYWVHHALAIVRNLCGTTRLGGTKPPTTDDFNAPFGTLQPQPRQGQGNRMDSGCGVGDWIVRQDRRNPSARGGVQRLLWRRQAQPPVHDRFAVAVFDLHGNAGRALRLSARHVNPAPHARF